MFDTLIALLQSLSPDYVLPLMIALAFGGLLIMLRFFGAAGLYVFIAIAIIAANIQVQKVVQFGFYLEPVALGTVLFSSSYLATDILNEYFGARAARRGVLIGFAASIFWLCVMLLTVGYAPLTPEQAGEGFGWALGTHDHIAALFTPYPAILGASIIAYLLSQFLDVWLFAKIRAATGGQMLWLRNNISTALSGLLDNVAFSTLAFVVFAADPVPWDVLIWVFILGTYGLRLVIALLDTPFMYLAKHCLPHDHKAA